MRTRAIAAVAAAVALLVPVAVAAQVLSCTVPAALSRPQPDTPDARQPRRLVRTAGYTLALTWSPQYCRRATGHRDDAQQCGAGNVFGFTLHGLWPDGPGKAWPQYCRPVELLREPTLRRNLCATPSVQLLQHEWAKHGSCMAGGADAYFDRARALYGRLRYPDSVALSRRPLTVGEFATAFARANPGMHADALRITATRDGWLDEVWLCLDRNYRKVRCPVHQRGVPASSPLKIWRGR